MDVKPPLPRNVGLKNCLFIAILLQHILQISSERNELQTNTKGICKPGKALYNPSKLVNFV